MNDYPHSEFNELKQQLKAERGRHFLSGFLYPALIADMAFVGAFALALMAVESSLSEKSEYYEDVHSLVSSCNVWSAVILVTLGIVTGFNLLRTRKIEKELMEWRTSHNHAIENGQKMEIDE